MTDRKMLVRKPSWTALAFGAYLATAISAAALPAGPAAAQGADTRAIASAIRSLSSSDREVAAFYRARNYQPIWTGGGFVSPEAERLLELIATADLDGVDPEHYRARRLVSALEQARNGSPRALARAEMMLSRAFVQYARDLRRPTNSGMTYVDKVLAPTSATPMTLLGEAARAFAAGQPVESAMGLNPLYKELRDGYAAWRARWASLPEVRIPAGPALTIGSQGERVRLLRERLGLSPVGAYDKSVAAAVKEFQEAYGLPTTGIAHTLTIEAMNLSRSEQEAKLRLNLQRARALPANQERYVLVDAAAQRLWMYENDRPVDSMKVIVGRATEPTPMLAALIRFAVVNPYWNVPPDMVKERIAPEVLKKGVKHLAAERYQVLTDWSDNARVVDPKKVDWAAVAAGRIELPVRQLPGRTNSMGAMKFMFPNDFGVYLHDTPQKKLFGQADRRQSAGCVRVEDAARLAKWLFGSVPAPKTPEPEQAVPLPRPVPVYITYLTAAPTETGIAFRNDFYGRDRASSVRFAGGASGGSQ